MVAGGGEQLDTPLEHELPTRHIKRLDLELGGMVVPPLPANLASTPSSSAENLSVSREQEGSEA